MSFKDINETVFQIKMLYFLSRMMNFSLFIPRSAAASAAALSLSDPKSPDKLEEINFSSADIQFRASLCE